MVNVKNPFRTADHRKLFAECIRSYDANNGGIRRDGLPCGNSASTEFWRGYVHAMKPNRYSDRYRNVADRANFGYVFWKAGELVAKSIVEPLKDI